MYASSRGSVLRELAAIDYRRARWHRARRRWAIAAVASGAA
jgi:hypothetical protein